MTKIRKALKEFLIFYLSGLFLTISLIALKICYPQLDSMLLVAFEGALVIPLIKEAFSRLKTKDFLENIKRRKDKK